MSSSIAYHLKRRYFIQSWKVVSEWFLPNLLVTSHPSKPLFLLLIPLCSFQNCAQVHYFQFVNFDSQLHPKQFHLLRLWSPQRNWPVSDHNFLVALVVLHLILYCNAHQHLFKSMGTWNKSLFRCSSVFIFLVSIVPDTYFCSCDLTNLALLLHYLFLTLERESYL